MIQLCLVNCHSNQEACRLTKRRSDKCAPSLKINFIPVITIKGRSQRCMTIIAHMLILFFRGGSVKSHDRYQRRIQRRTLDGPPLGLTQILA